KGSTYTRCSGISATMRRARWVLPIGEPQMFFWRTSAPNKASTSRALARACARSATAEILRVVATAPIGGLSVEVSGPGLGGSGWRILGEIGEHAGQRLDLLLQLGDRLGRGLVAQALFERDDPLADRLQLVRGVGRSLCRCTFPGQGWTSEGAKPGTCVLGTTTVRRRPSWCGRGRGTAGS